MTSFRTSRRTAPVGPSVLATDARRGRLGHALAGPILPSPAGSRRPPRCMGSGARDREPRRRHSAPDCPRTGRSRSSRLTARPDRQARPRHRHMEVAPSRAPPRADVALDLLAAQRHTQHRRVAWRPPPWAAGGRNRGWFSDPLPKRLSGGHNWGVPAAVRGFDHDLWAIQGASLWAARPTVGDGKTSPRSPGEPHQWISRAPTTLRMNSRYDGPTIPGSMEAKRQCAGQWKTTPTVAPTQRGKFAT